MNTELTQFKAQMKAELLALVNAKFASAPCLVDWTDRSTAVDYIDDMMSEILTHDGQGDDFDEAKQDELRELSTIYA